MFKRLKQIIDYWNCVFTLERERTQEKITMWIAWRIPKIIAMWCFYRMVAHATTGKWGNENPCGMTWETILDRWTKSNWKHGEYRSVMPMGGIENASIPE